MLAELAVTVAVWVVPPAPSPMPTIVNGACPVQQNKGHDNSCYYFGERRAYVLDAVDLQHELGHAYDDVELTDGERGALAATLRWRAWDRERFAEWYAACREVWVAEVADEWVFRPFRSVAKVARRCGMIARAGL